MLKCSVGCNFNKYLRFPKIPNGRIIEKWPKLLSNHSIKDKGPTVLHPPYYVDLKIWNMFQFVLTFVLLLNCAPVSSLSTLFGRSMSNLIFSANEVKITQSSPTSNIRDFDDF